jgi:hypothetical protein
MMVNQSKIGICIQKLEKPDGKDFEINYSAKV